MKTRTSSKHNRVISALVAVLLVVLLALITLRQLQQSLKRDREKVAVTTLKTIYNAEWQYRKTHSAFGSIRELIEAGLLPANVVAPSSIYNFTASGISTNAFCLHATRGGSAKAYRDFNINKQGAIGFIESSRASPLPCYDNVPTFPDMVLDWENLEKQ